MPFSELERTVAEIPAKLKTIPWSQLAAQKMVVNHAHEQMGLGAVQTLGPVMDGIMRNTPDALHWIEKAGDEGVRQAIIDRDGPFGDYSQAPQWRVARTPATSSKSERRLAESRRLGWAR